jgi:hydroxymethylpyrimidine pyrophosphatase-like HAD family hydrolase
MTPEIDIQAVLLDVDKTMVSNGSLDVPSTHVTDAIRRTGEAMPTGLVTARQPQKADYLIKHLELTGLSALSNGAQVFDAKNNQMVVERIIDHMAVMSIAEELHKLGIPFWVQDNGVDYVITDTQKTDEELRKYRPLSTYKPQKPLVIVGSPLPPDAVKTISGMIQAGYPQLTAFPAHRHPDGSVDLFIADQKTNKADAVKEIAERLGIDPKKFLAIGDGLNDTPFMQQCGIAVAVGNAEPEVKALANYIAPSWDNDGVADALERFVLFDRNTHKKA